MWKKLLALIYPSRCAGCDEVVDTDGFCAGCAPSVEPIAKACPRCGLPQAVASPFLAPSGQGEGREASPCLGCARDSPRFDWARASFRFGGAPAAAVRALKWGHRTELAPLLGGLLPVVKPDAVDLVVPVPLHPRRLRQRGFNQAALLAFGLPRQRRRPPVDIHALHRVRDTPPQSTLGLSERLVNVRGAFVAVRRRVAGRRVAVIDDVMTSGATADACARALKAAGAVEVGVLTLTRAVP
jgi:ComF family protein